MAEADLHQRAKRTSEILLNAAQSAGDVWVSPDLRIGVDDGAKLLGMAPNGFKKRLPSSGIRVYRVGGKGHKRTIRIYDLALWLESESDIGDAITVPLPASPDP